MNILSGIKKQKKKKFLIISASGLNKGLQVLYVELFNNEWTIISERTEKYSDEINEIIEIIKNENSKISVKNLSVLDYKFTSFLISKAKDTLSSLSKAQKKADLVILNKLTLWSGTVEHKESLNKWNYSIGNPSYLSAKLGIPVISDFLERAIAEIGTPFLPVLNGDMRLSDKISGPSLFVNLGLYSRLTIIGAPGYPVLVDLKCGPTTILIDIVAEKIGLKQGLDRDGNAALNGVPNTSIIEYLSEYFSSLSHESIETKFRQLLNTSKFKKLSDADLLATITAFAALRIINSYKDNYTDTEKPDTLWISGGGVNNLALVDYLKNYFSPITVKNVDTLGIVGNNRFPLSLALSVNSWINGEEIILPPNISGSIKNIGSLYFP